MDVTINVPAAVDVIVSDASVSVNVVSDATSSVILEIPGDKGDQGDPGVQGEPGSSGAETLTAGEIISAYRAVYVASDGKFYRLTSADVDHAASFIGITKEAVIADQESELHTFGLVTNNSWSLTPGAAVFIDDQGRLNNTPPTSGVNIRAGFAASATSVFFNAAELTIL